MYDFTLESVCCHFYNAELITLSENLSSYVVEQNISLFLKLISAWLYYSYRIALEISCMMTVSYSYDVILCLKLVSV